jgi:hypothetical protein
MQLIVLDWRLMTTEQVAWIAIGLPAAALFGSFGYLGTKNDSINARIDALAARLDARIDAIAGRLDAHLDNHSGPL